MRSTGKSAHRRECGRRYGGLWLYRWSICDAWNYSQIRIVIVVISRGVEDSLNVSDCTSATEIVRDVSTSLEMTNFRNVALVYFCAIGSVLAQAPPAQKSVSYRQRDRAASGGYAEKRRGSRR